MGRSKLLPGILLGVLLLPCITTWLDVARSASGKRYAYQKSARRVIVLGFDGMDW